MKDLIEHIDALIMEYDCVIIPDFGGFVLNKESASIGEVIRPPSVSVGFNTALKHNDGLLAESYMKSKSISYDAACKQINESVKKINGFLNAKQAVIFPKLGSFTLNEDLNITFTPTTERLKHPSTIGFSPIELRRLNDITKANQTQLQEYKQLGVRRTLAGIGAAAAAVLLFFTLSTPIKDVDKSQKASFFTTNSVISNNNIQQTQIQSIASESINTNYKTIDKQEITDSSATKVSEQPTISAKTEPMADSKMSKPSPGFYIIVGSCPTATIAKQMVSALKDDGFSDATIVPSKGRTRVSVAQFENKTVAERYLNNFRAEYSEFGDAWLLISR